MNELVKDRNIPALSNGSYTDMDIGVDLIWLNYVNPAEAQYEGDYVFEIKWHDGRLNWSESSFTDKIIYLPGSILWTPNIQLMQLNGPIKVDLDASSLRISSDGNVTAVLEVWITGVLQVFPYYYPKDEHVCVLNLYADPLHTLSLSRFTSGICIFIMQF